MKRDARTYTKRDLIAGVMKRVGGVHQCVAQDVVQAALDELTDILVAGGSLELRRFGVFEVVQRGARVGGDPRNPDARLEIPARRAVKFRPGKSLKRAVAGESAETEGTEDGE